MATYGKKKKTSRLQSFFVHHDASNDLKIAKAQGKDTQRGMWRCVFWSTEHLSISKKHTVLGLCLTLPSMEQYYQ